MDTLSRFLPVDTRVVVSQGDLAVRREQELPDDYLASLRQAREDSIRTPAGEFHRVASIPASLVDHWMMVDGFDVYQATPQEILAKLRRDDLHGFITSNKL